MGKRNRSSIGALSKEQYFALFAREGGREGKHEEEEKQEAGVLRDDPQQHQGDLRSGSNVGAKFGLPNEMLRVLLPTLYGLDEAEVVQDSQDPDYYNDNHPGSDWNKKQKQAEDDEYHPLFGWQSNFQMRMYRLLYPRSFDDGQKFS